MAASGWKKLKILQQRKEEYFRRGAETVGEDTGDMCMAVVEVSANDVCVLLGVVMMQVVEDDVVAGVSVDVTRWEEEEAGDAPVAAVDPVDSEDEEADDENEDNRTSVICQYFQ
ncbi:hypothetical protein NDU88_005588 [Pleurodeles waltl]|uniref:Uncharacterized protein n=1 Tax=Pleurodeles waltl TaxID=8319 RepID=A0AAV7RLH1_PLEWA|nr:hypothetical protein NDU88_005588 [Pleurodeles waltl]